MSGDCSTAEITSRRPAVGASVRVDADAAASRSLLRSLEGVVGLLQAASPPADANANASPESQAMRRVVTTSSAESSILKVTQLRTPQALP